MRLTVLLQAASRTRFNYFKRYVERIRDDASLRVFSDPIRGTTYKAQKQFYYDENRPWTDAFLNQNIPGEKLKKVLVEPLDEWILFKGDRVEILVGKDKGKQGIINCVIKERNWVFVEGLNCRYKIDQQFQGMPPTCTKEEEPLLVTTQVALVDPADEQCTDAEWRYTEEGEQVRVSARTGTIIPLPMGAKELEDFIIPEAYMENDDKDTKVSDLTEITFQPKLCSFEEDINAEMGIKDDRKPAKTYWY